MPQEEHTYSRFSILSIWQRHIGAGVTYDGDRAIAPEKLKEDPRYRGLDLDLYTMIPGKYGYGAYPILFEESAVSVLEKQSSRTEDIAKMCGAEATVVVQSPSPPSHLFEVRVPDERALREWALNQTLMFWQKPTDGTMLSMCPIKFKGFEEWIIELTNKHV